MKKVLLFTVAAIVGFNTIAKKHAVVSTQNNNVSGNTNTADGARAKTTAAGDTVVMENIHATDTPTIYLAAANRDSGYSSGTDAYGDKGYAERYDFNTGDSTVKVLGVVSIFSGKVNPASTKTVTFYAWKAAAQSATLSSTIFNSGFPGLAIDSVSASITHIGIRSVDTVSDTFKTFWFPTPTAQLNASFFVGYTINYNYAALAGDTISVYTNRDGERTAAIYTVVSGDTIINNQNTTMYNDGTWHDNATDNFGMQIDYMIFPVISAHRFPASVNGITNKGFTFFGCYPNPAATGTNVKFSLANNTDVTISIMDMSGKVARTVKEAGLAAGEHTLSVDTHGLSAGDYTFLIRTADGGGMASKLTIN